MTEQLTRQDAIARLTAPGQPFEFEPVEVFGRTCRAFRNAPATLHDLIRDNRSDTTFFVYGDERYTFDEIYRRSSALGQALRARYGIGKGDRVAISMRNYPEWVIAFNAATSIGAIAVCMNSMWRADEHVFGLSDSGAKVLIADGERVALLKERLPALAVQLIGTRCDDVPPAGMTPLDDLIGEHAGADMPAVEMGPNDDATILYTSGSTGAPKGAVSCHRNIISALLSWELDFMIGALMNQGALTGIETPDYQPASLLAIPLFHVTGLHAVLLSSYRSQRKVVSMYKWDVATAVDLIEREKIAMFIAPAAMTGDLVAGTRGSARDLSSLMTVGGGGAPRAPEQVKQIAGSFERAMPNTGWGMTETNAIGTGISGDNYLARPGSSGVASAVLDIAIVDEEGTHLPAGRAGEVLVRGTSVIRGYWNREEETRNSFLDGWFRSGDVGYLDEEGYLFIVDRIKDLVIRGGENIGCAEVEAALLEHPSVLEAAVYGIPDERLGEEIGATIYCTEPVAEEELRAFLSARLARFKIPRHLRFAREALPRIATGKIDKRRIRGEALAARAN